MKLLLTNDDGVFAEGFFALAKELSKKHQITLVAPESERSAIGHAITMHIPLRINRVNLKGLEHVECYATDGTPADCVKLGLNHILSDAPDLVISGINRGANLGTDILYSGTVSAALEASILGYKSIAVSIDSYLPEHYHVAAKKTAELIRRLETEDIPKGSILNINIPDFPENAIKGIKITPQGVTRYNEGYNERVDPRGFKYYWLDGELRESEENKGDTDVKWIKEGYITITPLKHNMTDEAYLKRLLCRFEN